MMSPKEGCKSTVAQSTGMYNFIWFPCRLITSWISISLVPTSTARALVVPKLAGRIGGACIYRRIPNSDPTRIAGRTIALIVSVAMAHLGMTDDSAALINIGGKSISHVVEILMEGRRRSGGSQAESTS